MWYLLAVIIAFATLGFWGGIIVSFLLSTLFRQISYGSGAINPLGNANRQKVFFDTLFICSGYIAKADNRVSKSEIEHMQHLFVQLHLDEATSTRAIELFRQGVSQEINLTEQLQHFNEVCGNTRSLKQTLFQYLITISWADGDLHNKELELLRKIGRLLHFSTYELNILLRMAQGQSRSGSADSRATKQADLQKAYDTLGASPSEPIKDITKKYRKLMNKNHPDKLIGQGLPKEMIYLATKKAQAIQNAYQLIKARHKDT